MNNPLDIQNELTALRSTLAGTCLPGNGFRIPVGYFDNFADSMLEKVKSVDTAELSPMLQDLRRNTPYIVPAGYFADLDPMAGIRPEKISSLLAGLKSKAIYKVPEGYFTDAHGSAELTDLSPLLHSISRTNPYSVPAGYFASLDPLAVVIRQPAKVVSMGSFNWKRSVAAAVVIAFVSASAFFFFDRDNSPSGVNAPVAVSTDSVASSVDAATSTDIYALNAADAAVISKLMKNVPDKAIQDFLNETDGDESVIDDELLN